MAGPRLPKRAEAGVVIGGYELVRRIGRGGMAEVWVARKALGKKGSKFVAIKLIADHYVGDERYARMFRAEAELAAVLSHANIVQVFDEGEEDGRSYLIMEWVDGLNLLKLGDMLALLDDEQRRLRVIAYIIGQLLHALNYAHSITSHDGSPLGVVHRDVSPQNVLVSNHGEVKLTDFGVAFHNFEESSGIHVKGKVRYMSPEQLSGQTRSPTVDLYAVGALLHELIDGRKFRGEFEDGQDLFSVVLSGRVSALSRTIPPELDRLRLGLLEPDPTRRIQTAEHAIALLKRYPGYGDARDELTKLCGSLTGVVRPRVGPGQSSQMAAAEQATTRWGGRNPLAKPKVSVGAAPPPLPPSRARAPSGPSRTGSTTAVKGPGEAIATSSALITGQTEFVKPQALAQAVAGGASPSAFAPTTPLRISNARKAVFGAPQDDPNPGAPAVVSVAPSSPLDVRADASASPAPMHVPTQSSSPLDVRPLGVAGPAPAVAPTQPSSAPGHGPAGHVAPVPTQIHGRASYPGEGQPGPIWVDQSNPSTRVPPTERLPMSEASGVAAPPGGTEVFDASMLSEIPSGSGTEQEILSAAVAGDGTDTRRELRGGLPTQSNSVSIVLPRRSAVALIGLGLVLVAVTSVSVTWFLFSRGRDDGATRGGMGAELAASLVEPRAAGPEEEDDAAGRQEPAAVEPEPAVVSGGDAQPPEGDAPAEEGDAAPSPDEAAGAADDEANAAAADVPATPGEELDAPETEIMEAPEPSHEEERAAEAEPSTRADAGTAKRSSSPPASKKPSKPKALPGAFLKVTSSTGLEKAEVRVGSEIFSVSERRMHGVSAGRKSVKWRKSASDPWKTVKPWSFKPGKRYVVHISKAGPSFRNVD